MLMCVCVCVCVSVCVSVNKISQNLITSSLGQREGSPQMKLIG